MSCGCTNKLYHLPSCPQGMTAPVANCPEGEPCDTVYTAGCVVYTGPSIPCYGIAPGDKISEVLEKLIAAVFPPCQSSSTTSTSTSTTSTTTVAPTTSTTTVAPTTTSTTTLAPTTSTSTTTEAPTTTTSTTTEVPTTTTSTTSTTSTSTTSTSTTSTTSTTTEVPTTTSTTSTTSTTTETPTTTTINPNSVISVVLATTPAGVCSGTCQIRYTFNGVFETGENLYLANGQPVTGFNYVALCDAGAPVTEIYNLDPITGIIGAGTGQFC